MVFISITSSLSFSSSSCRASSDLGRFSLNQPREKRVGQDSFNLAKASAFSCSRTSLSIFLQKVNSSGLSELNQTITFSRDYPAIQPNIEASHNYGIFIDLIIHIKIYLAIDSVKDLLQILRKLAEFGTLCWIGHPAIFHYLIN